MISPFLPFLGNECISQTDRDMPANLSSKVIATMKHLISCSIEAGSARGNWGARGFVSFPHWLK